MNKVGFISLGCSKNLVDTEIMIGVLQKEGYTVVNDESLADVIIVNTCGFIDAAKEEAINTILEMSEYKETGNLKLLVVAGCLAQRYKDEILKELPEVDIILGVGSYPDIAKIINEKSGSVFMEDQNRNYPEELPRVLSTPFYTAYLKIAEGCDNNCTYCAIPSIRGRYRSRKIEDIVCEAKTLAKKGVLEMNIIAQDTTRYGLDIYGKESLVLLLKELVSIDEIMWLRVLYTYPEMITDEIIDIFAKSEKIAKYFDIPIQHISDSVLKRMGRKSRKEGIYILIEKIRNKIPKAIIRTSLIVGFPGETEEDFKELCEFVKWAKFDKMGVFKYSREEGTPAFKLDGQIDEEVKEERYNTLMQVQQEISAKIGIKKIGSEYLVLTEGSLDGYYYGRSINDAPQIDGKVFFKTDNTVNPGEMVKVKILASEDYDLIGEMI